MTAGSPRRLAKVSSSCPGLSTEPSGISTTTRTYAMMTASLDELPGAEEPGAPGTAVAVVRDQLAAAARRACGSRQDLGVGGLQSGVRLGDSEVPERPGLQRLLLGA